MKFLSNLKSFHHSFHPIRKKTQTQKHLKESQKVDFENFRKTEIEIRLECIPITKMFPRMQKLLFILRNRK